MNEKKNIPTIVFLVTTVVFIVMKLTGIVDWSWWIVFLPIWGPIAVTLAALLLITMLMWILGLMLVMVNNTLERNARHGQSDGNTDTV